VLSRRFSVAPSSLNCAKNTICELSLKAEMHQWLPVFSRAGIFGNKKRGAFFVLTRWSAVPG
jgi:hypothetical protein